MNTALEYLMLLLIVTEKARQSLFIVSFLGRCSACLQLDSLIRHLMELGSV